MASIPAGLTGQANTIITEVRLQDFRPAPAPAAAASARAAVPAAPVVATAGDQKEIVPLTLQGLQDPIRFRERTAHPEGTINEKWFRDA